MVTFSMTFTYPYPGFQGHCVFEVVEYFKNGVPYGQSYYMYSILIGNHTYHMEWYHVW